MYAEDKQTIIDRREMLRIKVKSLVEESKIIRREERRTFGDLRDEMRNHRVFVVRSASRSSGLAYGLVKGLTMEQMEPTRLTDPNWDAIKKMLAVYGPRNHADILEKAKASKKNVKTKTPSTSPRLAGEVGKSKELETH